MMHIFYPKYAPNLGSEIINISTFCAMRLPETFQLNQTMIYCTIKVIRLFLYLR